MQERSRRLEHVCSTAPFPSKRQRTSPKTQFYKTSSILRWAAAPKTEASLRSQPRAHDSKNSRSTTMDQTKSTKTQINARNDRLNMKSTCYLLTESPRAKKRNASVMAPLRADERVLVYFYHHYFGLTTQLHTFRRYHRRIPLGGRDSRSGHLAASIPHSCSRSAFSALECPSEVRFSVP